MLTTEQSPAPGLPRPRTLNDVPGWLWDFDRFLFDVLLTYQDRTGQRGDLLELGSFHGKSAIVIGCHQRADETFTVCDLFEFQTPDEANAGEVATWYGGLSQAAFEANYLAFHDRMPTVVQGPTSILADGRIPDGSCRFAHVDASHLYDHVAADIQIVKKALAPTGIVALDDYRHERTPGVAAAVWEAVLTHGLRPVVLSANKFYGTWGDPTVLREKLMTVLGRRQGLLPSTESVAGQVVLRIEVHALPPTPLPLSRHYHAEVEALQQKIAELKRANGYTGTGEKGTGETGTT